MLFSPITILVGSLALTTALEIPLRFAFDWQERFSWLGFGALSNDTAGETKNSGCKIACDLLHELLPPAPIFDKETTAYWKEKSHYWSVQQSDLKPACFVQPTTVADVSRIVLLAQETQCQFAVKSGGHAAFVGASNIEGGITIDLSLLNEISVSSDEKTTSVGPGNRWHDVYAYLVPKRLMVIGGRDEEIGVGGLTLGGGISWFSGRYGWAADGVRNYQLVVASGEVLDVNLESYPDLYWALRGGGNNLGVVTRFDLETFEQGQMWGGSLTHSQDKFGDLLDAFVGFAEGEGGDVDGGTYTAFAWYQAHQMWIAATAIVYAKPVKNPRLFENYTKLEAVHSTCAMRDMCSISVETSSNSPNGLRESYWTATFKIDRALLQDILDIYMEEFSAVKEVESIIPALVYQPMTKDVISNFQHNGGNCLGIEEGEGPLLNINIAVMWAKARDDEAVLHAARETIRRSTVKAKERGLDHRYLYQNYASQEQDVFAGYGEENRKRLREISQKWDPDQVFQRLQPGYFKI